MALPGNPRTRLVCALFVAVVMLLAACGPSHRAAPFASSFTPLARAGRTSTSPARAAPATSGPPAPAATVPAVSVPFTPQPTPAPTRAPDDLLRFAGKEFEPLPADYTPPDLTPLPATMSAPAGLLLRAAAAQAFMAMWQAARNEGVYFVAVSTYRSYQDQVQVYATEVATFGQQTADSESAQPGRSEHQLGLAIDLSTPAFGYALDENFSRSPEGIWISQHAAEYGFVISYPQGQEQITGYRFEPWHIRYVGVEAARAIVASGRTSTEALESWRQITAGPTPLPATPPPATPASMPPPSP